MQAIQSHAMKLVLAVTPFFYSCAMATDTVLLWPEIQGQILNNGKPVEGLDLTQILYWNYEENKAAPRKLTIRTDKNGGFTFPKVTGDIKQTLFTRLFYQPGIVMEIRTHYQSKNYSVHVAGSSSHFSSTQGGQVLECELNTAEMFDGILLVTCKETSK